MKKLFKIFKRNKSATKRPLTTRSVEVEQKLPTSEEEIEPAPEEILAASENKEVPAPAEDTEAMSPQEEELEPQAEELVQSPEPITLENPDDDPELHRVTFAPDEDLRWTKPMRLILQGEELSFQNNAWAWVLVAVTEWLITTQNPRLSSLEQKAFIGERPFLLAEEVEDRACKLLSNGKWLSTQYSADALVTIINKLCAHCRIPLDDITIYYKKQQGSEAEEGDANVGEVQAEPYETGEATPAASPIHENPEDDPELHRVTFAPDEDLRWTKPMRCILQGKELPLTENTWAQTLLTLTEWLITAQNPRLSSLEQKALIGERPFLLAEEDEDRPCKLLSNGKWLFTQYNADTLVTIINKLCAHCDIPLDDIAIYYKENKAAKERAEEAAKEQTQSKADTDILDEHGAYYWRVDFRQPENYDEARPVRCTLQGQQLPLDEQRWSAVLIAITEWLIAQDHPKLAVLEQQALYGIMPFLQPEKEAFIQGSQLSNGKWIRTNNHAQNMISVISKLCDHCSIDLNDVEILCESTQDTTLLKQQITELLLNRYRNGFRFDFIEMKRFRSFAAEAGITGLPSEDKALEAYIRDCGMSYENKIYVITNEAREKIRKGVEHHFDQGAAVIFFEAFYTLHWYELEQQGVLSEEMLRILLQDLFPELNFTLLYFGSKTGAFLEVVKDEILRVWGNNFSWDCEQLAKRLPCIPLPRIKNTLVREEEFIWNEKETYVYAAQIHITDEEVTSIRDLTEKACTEQGYISMGALPLEEIRERNDQLSEIGLYNAVYRLCLADTFHRQGKVLSHKGEKLDVSTILIDYCRKQDQCTLEELRDYAKNELKEDRSYKAISAANTVLVRIDKDRFVADDKVHFDIEAIDAVIEKNVPYDYLPIKAFTSFSDVPSCGYRWNLHLLESYCRRFSKQFRIDALSENSTNIGVIVRKRCGLSYEEIMSDAVARSNIPLKKDDVNNYLFNEGYSGSRNLNRINDILKKAQDIRQRIG